MITCRDIINKRKQLWVEHHDIDYDKSFVEAAVRKLLSTKELVGEVREKPYLLVEIAFYIVNKRRETVPFFFNEVQEDFIKQLEKHGTKAPYFILKGRQQGFTSVITAIQLSFAIVRKNFSGFTIADRTDNTLSIFNDKAKVVYNRLPELLHPQEKFNSRNELFFDRLNSSWRIATASDEVGRSRTLNFVHYSEVAFYECDLSKLQKGIGEAITADAIVVYESTANGFNQAKDLWDSGSCRNLFYGWWRSKEYRSTEYQYLDTKDNWLLARIDVLKEMGLDREQITWYCKKYASYLDKSSIRQEYPITPEEAFVSSGECVFDKETISNHMAKIGRLQVGKKGFFEYEKEATPVKDKEGNILDVEWHLKNIKFKEAQDGYITIHEEPRVKTNKQGEVVGLAPYVLGGDTAGSGEDYFTAKVICNFDGKTVATMRKQYIDEDIYAEQMYCLGKYYHDALIGIEINYSRQPMRVLHKTYNYPNLYMREETKGVVDRQVAEYGFLTTPKTRPIIIADLVRLMRDDVTIECDYQTLKEMTTFIKKANGRQEAIDGEHDDLVMAKAIAHFISRHQTYQWLEVEKQESTFLQDNFNLDFNLDENSSFMNWEDW